ncbi:MAG: hypothetical protein KatS3mg011_1738 [Acidimicrobiia bacterium]|nr:MAG: hypothetical protein KatS3mg011_1738 [Acidimicrobiia bacterium]
MDWPVTYRRRVRFSDTDAQGIVFNANYLVYFDDTITDYFDALGLGWEEFERRGYDMVLAHAELDFKSPARLGETLLTGARVGRVGKTSVRFQLATWEEESGRPVVEGEEVHVFLDRSSFTKTPVPEFFLEAVESLQGEEMTRS